MVGMEKRKEYTMYEYVTKKEYAPVKVKLESILRRIQQIMASDYELEFKYELIGSGKRHLITRIKDGNKGFDFDYNLIIPHPGQGYHYKADVIKSDFIEAFKIALKGTQYSFPKDSTSAITVKMVDKVNSKIKYSCDFAIMYYDENDGCDGYMYLRNDKSTGNYHFAFRSYSRTDTNEKLAEILEYEDGWNWIRDEYLKLKNRNESNKHSFSLYIEAINNIYNQMNQ